MRNSLTQPASGGQVGHSRPRSEFAKPPKGDRPEYTDAETGFVYLRARYYDPATGQFLTRDPLVSLTGSAYGYVGGNPLNGTDPTELLCVTFLDSNCESFAQQHAKGAQQVADFAGGVLNTVTLGNERRVTSSLGQQNKVDRCSGYYTAGEVTGGVAVVGLGLAVGEGPILNEVGSIGGRFTEDQQALVQLAKEAKQLGGLSSADARGLWSLGPTKLGLTGEVQRHTRAVHSDSSPTSTLGQSIISRSSSVWHEPRLLIHH